MQQRNKVKRDKAVQIFTASEIAEYEYCPLVWWYEKYDPLVETGTEELFAHLVAMEHEHGSQATAIPEYQVIEQLLVRRGAFEADGRVERTEQDESAAEMESERADTSNSNNKMRRLRLFALMTLTIAVVLLVLSFLSIFLY